MSGFVSCILLLLGWRISFNNNIFLQMTIPDFSYALHFSVWRKKAKGGYGKRIIQILLHLSLPLISHPFGGDMPRRLAVVFILTYSYLHTGRYFWSVKLMELFMKVVFCWSDAFVKVSVVFYTSLCRCLALYLCERRYVKNFVWTKGILLHRQVSGWRIIVHDLTWLAENTA